MHTNYKTDTILMIPEDIKCINSNEISNYTNLLSIIIKSKDIKIDNYIIDNIENNSNLKYIEFTNKTMLEVNSLYGYPFVNINFNNSELSIKCTDGTIIV